MWLPLCAIALMAVNAQAANVGLSDAKAVAAGFINNHNALLKGAAGQLSLAHTEGSSVSTDANSFYVFNLGDNGGFVIVAGEDRAPQVLGYSDHGSFSWDAMPGNMKVWLSGYRQQIEYLQQHPELVAVKQEANLNRMATPTVGPLCSTTWGQEEPYYNQCPKSGGEYCVVGCVATAMAQVMNYWKYPSGPTPSFNAYTTNGITVSALPSTTFDWANMLDSYCHWDYTTSALVQDTYTTAQANAVAEVGRYCGQAVNMSYSPDGSGAYTWNQESAMEEFGFDILTGLKYASSYSTTNWKQMLNADLDAHRPILYSASDDNGDGGHAFIIDGYDSDGNYHLNWGWYGTGDGWYAINALNVTHRDGTNLKYNTSQQAILGVQPPADAITTYPPVMTEATNVTSTSFTATWTDQTDAENVSDYTLYVNTKGLKPDPMLLEEVSWSSSASVPDGWTSSGLNYYSPNQAAYLSSTAGYVQTKNYSLEEYDSLTVMIQIQPYGSNNKVTLTTSQGGETLSSFTSGSFNWYTVTLPCSSSDYVKLTSSGSPDMRAMKIYAGNPADAALRAATETGDATKRVITGITDKTYTVQNLTEGGTFTFYVVANYINNTSSKSNTMEVTLTASAGNSDINDDGVWSMSDVTTLIAYVLGNNPTPCLVENCDVNGDGNVSMSDVTTLIAQILGN